MQRGAVWTRSRPGFASSGSKHVRWWSAGGAVQEDGLRTSSLETEQEKGADIPATLG